MSKLLYNFIEPKKAFISQKYGENRACVNDEGYIITCDGNNPPEGYRSVYGEDGHRGIDVVMMRENINNKPLYAPQRGIVRYIDTNKRTGFDIRIECEERGVKILYVLEHLNQVCPTLHVGASVKTGQYLGLAGSTGYSSGPHVHVETYIYDDIDNEWDIVDPMRVFDLDIYSRDIMLINDTLAWGLGKLADIATGISLMLRKKV